MTLATPSRSDELDELRSRLAEAEDTLRAIRAGEIDGLIVQGATEDRLLALADGDAFYRVLIDEMPEGALVLDSGATVVYANMTFAQMLAAEPKDVVGRQFLELLSAESRPMMERSLARGTPGPVAGADYLRGGPDGAVPVSISLRRLSDGHDGAQCVIVSDLTHRQRTERAAAHLAAVVESSADAIISGDLTGTVRSWNRAAERMFGFRDTDVIGRHACETVAHGRADEVAQNLRDVGQGHPVKLYETTRMTRAHGAIDVAVTVSPITDSSGRIVGTSEISRDVTERNRIEAALREAEARFRTAFDQAGTGMAMIGIAGSDAGRILQVNEALSRLTRYPDAQLVGAPFERFIHPDDVSQRAVGVRQLLDGEIEDLSGELRLVAADGTVIWALATTSMVRMDDGALAYRILQVQDITERKRIETELSYLADHDQLTGLLNRGRFEQELEREVEQSQRYGTGGALLALDLDGFKYVNDTLGHAAGDAVIRAVAAVLRERLRDTDIIGRLGGDEFAVILPQVDRDGAIEVSQMLKDRLGERVTMRGSSGAARATASIGVALFHDGGRRLQSDELMSAADIALYDAKDAGRNRVCLSQPAHEPATARQARRSCADLIRSALDEDRFVLYAQPIVSLDRPSPPRFELLIRMVTPSGEIVEPSAFIPAAERFDLIQEIDQWVVSRAISMLSSRAIIHTDTCFDLNVSAKSLADNGLSSWIERKLAGSDVDPSRLTFEITESAAIVSMKQADAFAQTLKQLGAGFALDDFGAGFSSFYYLKHLPFDYVKIDGEFIRDVVHNGTDRLVVRAIVELVAGLGGQTIAEFVGDEPTVRLLRELGVDHAQGFHLGEPCPLSR